MTQEEEKQFVLLLSIAELGGHASKKAVLDRIESCRYLRLEAHALDTMDSRSEPRWRNDLAFTRHHLVLADYMSGLVRNRWEITKAGITRLDELTRLAANSQMEIATKRALDAARLYCSSKTTTP